MQMSLVNRDRSSGPTRPMANETPANGTVDTWTASPLSMVLRRDGSVADCDIHHPRRTFDEWKAHKPGIRNATLPTWA